VGLAKMSHRGGLKSAGKIVRYNLNGPLIQSVYLFSVYFSLNDCILSEAGKITLSYDEVCAS
jgi:hypothetical protein